MGSTRKRKRRSCGNAQSSPVKRRRLSNGHRKRHHHAVQRAEPSKRSTEQPAATCPAAAATASTVQPQQAKRKHRQRCHKLCAVVVDKITKALRSVPCPIAHLFRSTDDEGIPIAPLSEIVPVLSLPPRVLTLPASKLALLNGEIFQMDVIENDKMIVKYPPLDFNVEDATVYLDRLPYPCSAWLLGKFCAKFGTVVDARLPLRTPAPLKGLHATVIKRKRTHHRGFAFVQFSQKEEAEAMCKEFARNHPTAPHSRHRWFFNRGRRCHLGQNATKFAALTVLRRARMLRLKQRLEKALRRKLQLRQWKKEWKQKRRKMLKEKRKKKRYLVKLRKAGKLPAVEKATETPKKTKKEKRKEANKKRRKRLSALKKEARLLLANGKMGQAASGSESAMETSDDCSPMKKSTLNNASVPVAAEQEKSVQVTGNSQNEEKTKQKVEAAQQANAPVEKKKRRWKRREIRKSIRSHFIDVQAMPFAEYKQMREEYLRMVKVERQKDSADLRLFRAKNRNHKREEFREEKWSLEVDEEDEEME